MREENLYLRYEDTVVVTETGVENFTDFLPSELADMEKLVQEKGVVQKVPPIPAVGDSSGKIIGGILSARTFSHLEGACTMDLLQLEHFLAVVEERTFTRAAERVCRTQPAVSQSIKKLEEEVGAPLFARDVHEVSLTEAGRVLADYARRMVHLRDEALRQVTELKSLKAGTLAIAAHESAAVYLLPAPLRAYLQKFPDIKVGIYRSRLNEIPRQVMDREVDVGFVKDEPAFHELQWVDVHSDEMMCIASPQAPAGGEDRGPHPGPRRPSSSCCIISAARPRRRSSGSSSRTARAAGSSPSSGASRTSRASSRKKSAWRSCPASPSGRSCATARSSASRCASWPCPAGR